MSYSASRHPQKGVQNHSGAFQYSDSDGYWSDSDEDYANDDDWDQGVRDEDRKNPYVVSATAATLAELKPWDHWDDFGEVYHQPHCNRIAPNARAR